MKPCTKSIGLSTIQKQKTLTTFLAVHCAYLLTVCRQAGVWTLCLGTPDTWMCPHCDLPNLSWLAAHHLEGHSDSDWACSDTSYKLRSALAPNTQKRMGTCNFTSGQQQVSFLCWWGKRPHMPRVIAQKRMHVWHQILHSPLHPHHKVLICHMSLFRKRLIHQAPTPAIDNHCSNCLQ